MKLIIRNVFLTFTTTTTTTTTTHNSHHTNRHVINTHHHPPFSPGPYSFTCHPHNSISVWPWPYHFLIPRAGPLWRVGGREGKEEREEGRAGRGIRHKEGWNTYPNGRDPHVWKLTFNVDFYVVQVKWTHFFGGEGRRKGGREGW